jgi:hypothetical protein
MGYADEDVEVLPEYCEKPREFLDGDFVRFYDSTNDDKVYRGVIHRKREGRKPRATKWPISFQVLLRSQPYRKHSCFRQTVPRCLSNPTVVSIRRALLVLLVDMVVLVPRYVAKHDGFPV